MATRCGVVLFLALAVVLAQAPTASAAGGAARFVPPYNVCTSDWAPIVSGSPSANCEHSQQPGLKAGTAINTKNCVRCCQAGAKHELSRLSTQQHHQHSSSWYSSSMRMGNPNELM
jgi:hypothetical protein